MFVARNRVFLEKEFLKGEKSGRTVQLEEVRDEPIGSDSTSDANVADQVEVPMAGKHRHNHEGRQGSAKRENYYCWTVMSL